VQLCFGSCGAKQEFPRRHATHLQHPDAPALETEFITHAQNAAQSFLEEAA
jgi:hypothetical protein